VLYIQYKDTHSSTNRFPYQVEIVRHNHHELDEKKDEDIQQLVNLDCRFSLIVYIIYSFAVSH